MDFIEGPALPDLDQMIEHVTIPLPLPLPLSLTPPPPSQIALLVGTTSDLKYDPIFYGRLRSTLGTPITIGKTRSQSTVSKKLPQ